MNNVALSLDTQCAKNPALINLKKEDLANNDWLNVFTNASKFREFVNNSQTNNELWILSSDNIEAINLAAACKKDKPASTVCLISYDLSGSLKSRAKAAGIDSVLNVDSFIERFEANKRANDLLKNQSKAVTNIQKMNMNKVPNLSSSSGNTSKCFVLSILSASGGSGRSTVSVMSALLSQSYGLNTLLLDGDLQFGETSLLIGAKNPLTIDELIANPTKINNLKANGNIPAVLAPPSMPELAEKVLENFSSLLKLLKEKFDVIVINTSSFWNELQAILLENENKSLFLIDQRPSSIHSTKTAIDLCDRCGIATGSVLFALNRCSKKALFSSVDVSYALNNATVVEVVDGGLEVDECLSSGQALDLIQNQNPFAVSLWNILEDLLPKTNEQNDNLQVSRNMSRFGKNKKSKFGKRKK